jgi:DNA helicase-2/ATP-dependent DNA helicase PcrA
MEQDYAAAYKLLNAEQKAAVDYIEGPLLVVAGPGTGKTELLSLRVANILLKTDADASNILCLTFTNKAAVNMRKRLHARIGAESRYVAVRTFHSFSAEIMNNYPDYFWQGARLSVAPEAVQLEIIQSILAGLPDGSPLASSFAGAFTALGDVQNALRLVKEAGLLPDELRSIINQNLAYIDSVESSVVDLLSPTLKFKALDDLMAGVSQLPPQDVKNELSLPLSLVMKESLSAAIEADRPTGKTKQTGKWKLRWVQTVNGEKGMFAERKRNQWWLALADVYELYREQLPERGYYDYDDMLIEVLQQLGREPDMLADLQERFQYVLIDEFQDTNAAQLRLAHLIADHYAANSQPNLMAVGDDDQSIFAFNGAELNNMLEFKRSYPAAKLIVLEDNYRSTQAILDSARQVIEQAEDRLVKREKSITKNLVAARQADKMSVIEHVSWPTREHQQTGIAARIKELHQSGADSIAVLARTHESLKQLAAILLNLGIPVNYERQSNLLEHPAVRQVILIADTAVAIAEGDTHTSNRALSELLRHEMWALSPKKLWELAQANFSSPDWLTSLLESPDKHLRTIGEWLIWLGRQSQSNSLTYLLDHILGLEESTYLKSPFRSYYIDLPDSLSSDYLETLSALEILRELSEEFAGKGEASLADFMRFVKLNLSTNRVIADESWFASDERAVHLLTVYKAKGLEYDNVFLIDAIDTAWQPRVNRRPSPGNLRLESYGEKYDDYVRLLYVALSRAKQNFIATSYYTDGRGVEVLPTSILAGLPTTRIDEPAEASIEVIENDLRWPRLNSKDEKSLLKTRLENYSLSQSALIDFLNVAEAGPTSFLERNLLRLPRGRSPQGSYGTAVHAALETAQRLVNLEAFEIGTVLDRFEATLREEHLPSIDYERYHGRGLALLTSLFEDKKLILSKGGLTEQRLADIRFENASINGNLDRIDVDEDKIIISDYKTGAPLSSFDTKDRTKAVKAWRHRTQLLFYSLLVRESRRFPDNRPVQAQMIYLESEAASKMNLALTPETEELERLQKLIEVIWSHVINLNFPDTSKYAQDRAGIENFENDLLLGKI